MQFRREAHIIFGWEGQSLDCCAECSTWGRRRNPEFLIRHAQHTLRFGAKRVTSIFGGGTGSFCRGEIGCHAALTCQLQAHLRRAVVRRIHQRRCMLSLGLSTACSVVGSSVGWGLPGVGRAGQALGFFQAGGSGCLPAWTAQPAVVQGQLVSGPCPSTPHPCFWCACFTRACGCLLPLLGAGVQLTEQVSL